VPRDAPDPLAERLGLVRRCQRGQRLGQRRLDDVIDLVLRHPPPDLFGPNTTQLDGTPVFQADQSRSYKTNQPDASGFRAFTDAYRMGRAIVIVYVIGRDGPETESVRKSVAEAINQRAPR